MPEHRPSRWRRRESRQRDAVRRMFAAGALVSLVVALAAVAYVSGRLDGDVRDLARLALLLPPAVFVAWWLMFPGFRVDADAADVAPQQPEGAGSDVDERIARIAAAFDDGAVPRPARAPSPQDARVRESLLRTVRRGPGVDPDGDALAPYGLRRRNPSAPSLADEA